MSQPGPDESALSAGVRWATRVSTIGLEFAIPPFIGVFFDKRWHTTPMLTTLGAALGFAVGMLHVLRIAREESAKGRKSS